MLLLISIYVFKYTGFSDNYEFTEGSLDDEIPEIIDFGIDNPEIIDFGIDNSEIIDFGIDNSEIIDFGIDNSEYSEYADDNINEPTARTKKRNYYYYFGFIAALMIVYELYVLKSKYFRKNNDKFI